MPPPGYTQLRLLKDTEYVREILPKGATVVVDEATARRWLAAKIATASDKSLPLQTTCPKCQAPFQTPAQPGGRQFWVQCPSCRFGWSR